MASFFKISFLLLLAGTASAKPFTLEDIKNAKTIAIMPGTFDPITEGHIGVAEKGVTEGGADITILIASENPKKTPIPRPERLKLMDLALADSPHVVYAKEGGDLYDAFTKKNMAAIVRQIRKVNPAAEIKIVVGSDVPAKLLSSIIFGLSVRPKEWLIVPRQGSEAEKPSWFARLKPNRFLSPSSIPGSSSSIKKYIGEHLDQMGPAGEGAKPREIPGLRPAEAEYIFANHLYIPGEAEKNMGFCTRIFKNLMKKVMP